MDLDAQYDWSTVPDAKEFTLLPAGRYHVAVEAVGDVLTSKNNNDYCQLTLRVLSGEYSGAVLYDTLAFTPDSLDRVKWVAAHLADIDIAKPFSIRQVLQALPGKQAIADVKVEQGQMNPQTGQPYPPKNKIHFTGYSRPEGFAYIGAGQATATAPASQPAHASAPTQPPVGKPTSATPNTAPTPAAAAPGAPGAAKKKGMPF